MIDRIPGIDRSRAYVTGLSNGGMMAYTLACNTDLFVAIGPVAATQLDPCTNPRPTSVMHVHGLADETAASVARLDPRNRTYPSLTPLRCVKATSSGAVSTRARRRW